MDGDTIRSCCSCVCGAWRKVQLIENPSLLPPGHTQSTNVPNCDGLKSDFMSTGSGGERPVLCVACGTLRRNAA
jgi:hypothetical protein